jgi:hypothetical protein
VNGLINVNLENYVHRTYQIITSLIYIVEHGIYARQKHQKTRHYINQRSNNLIRSVHIIF